MKLTEVSTNSQDIFPFYCPWEVGGEGGLPYSPFDSLLICVRRRKVNWIAFVWRPSATITHMHSTGLHVCEFKMCSSAYGCLQLCVRVSIWASIAHWRVRSGSVWGSFSSTWTGLLLPQSERLSWESGISQRVGSQISASSLSFIWSVANFIGRAP